MPSIAKTKSATVRVLVRNLQPDTAQLEFPGFTISSLGEYADFKAAQEYFPGAMRDEWMLKREYPTIPSAQEDWSGFGAIPGEIEDLLVLLRLFRPGDLAFAALKLEDSRSKWQQYPYRAISPLVSSSSLRPYVINQSECPTWGIFRGSLVARAGWKSGWFSVSRRFLLYGGGKEFNANFEDSVDRVVDYITALEAALVPESDFVSRRLRERAQRLLDLRGDAESTAIRRINEMYAIRSNLVHGSPLSTDQLALLQDKDKWWRFEEIVREVLVEALRRVPSDEPLRRSYLASLYDVTDTERAAQILQSYRAMKNDKAKRTLVESF